MPDNESLQRAGTGRDDSDSGDHERRIQKLELAQGEIVANMREIRTAHESLTKELFGDPKRQDEGGKGAFARIEGLLTHQTVDLTQKMDAVSSTLTAKIETVQTAVAADESTRAKRRALLGDRRFQVALYGGLSIGGVVLAYILGQITTVPHP